MKNRKEIWKDIKCNLEFLWDIREHIAVILMIATIMEGKSCKEICEKLDLPIGTVNPALRRARIHIKKEKTKFESRAKKVDDINIQNRKYKRWKRQKSINS